MNSQRASFLCGLFLATSAVAGESEIIPVCEAPSRDELDAAAELNGWLQSTRVRVETCPAEGGPTRKLAFVRRGSEVVLRLQTGGVAREREVPWLDQTDTPLSRLRANGALAKVSVIIEALLAEERLDASTSQRPVEAKVPPRPRERRPTPSPVAQATLPPPVEAPPAPVPPPPAPVVAPPTAVTESAPPPLPEARRWPWRIEASAGGRLRSPGILSAEFAASVAWGPVRVGASYDPRVVFSLGGIPVAIAGVGARGGAGFDVFRGGSWFLGWDAALRVEWLSLRRLDVAGAASAGYADLGIGAGLHGGAQLGPIAAELQLAGLLMPTGRIVEIQDGPRERVGLWGVQMGVGLSWRSVGVVER